MTISRIERGHMDSPDVNEQFDRIAQQSTEPADIELGVAEISVILPQPAIYRYVGHASLHPMRTRPLKRQELTNYPAVSQELMELLVEPDPDRESKDGNLMLAELMEKAPGWAKEAVYAGLYPPKIEDVIVRRIQDEYNVKLDSRAIGAAKGIARDAVNRALYGHVKVRVPEKATITKAPLRSDVPSVNVIVGGDGEIYHTLLTPKEREEYEISTITVHEETLSQEALKKLFGSKETGQGE